MNGLSFVGVFGFFFGYCDFILFFIFFYSEFLGFRGFCCVLCLLVVFLGLVWLEVGVGFIFFGVGLDRESGFREVIIGFFIKVSRGINYEK